MIFFPPNQSDSSGLSIGLSIEIQTTSLTLKQKRQFKRFLIRHIANQVIELIIIRNAGSRKPGMLESGNPLK